MTFRPVLPNPAEATPGIMDLNRDLEFSENAKEASKPRVNNNVLGSPVGHVGTLAPSALGT